MGGCKEMILFVAISEHNWMRPDDLLMQNL